MSKDPPLYLLVHRTVEGPAGILIIPLGAADTSLSWNPEQNSVTGRPTDNGGAFVK